MFRRIIFFAGLFVIMTAGTIQAGVSLSINPITGGSSLRFGRAENNFDINKEVRIRVNSSDGTQYQVFQRLVEPLVNEQGGSLGFDAISTYSVSNSNAFGTLYVQNITNLSQSDELLYTSDPQGDSDGFTFVYTIRHDRLDTPGNFTGRILYTVRPVGSGLQDSAFLTVFLESQGELKYEIQGTSSRDRVRVSYSAKENLPGEEVKINFSGNNGGYLKIYQELESFPQNELMNELNHEFLKFKVSGGSQGELQGSSPTNLERNKILLYQGSPASDTVLVDFLIDPAQWDKQKAGTYRGRLKYTIEAPNEINQQSLDLEVVIEPIFNMEVKLPPEGVKFINLLPTGAPQFSEVNVVVKSNLGKPYMVSQNVVSPMTNPAGEVIASEHFSLKGELNSEQKGRVAYSEFSSVPHGQAPIFFSDNQGSSADFKILYRLKPYNQMRSGDYSTSIVYSLGEI